MHLAAQPAHAGKKGIAFIAEEFESTLRFGVEGLCIIPVIDVGEFFSLREELSWFGRYDRLELGRVRN